VFTKEPQFFPNLTAWLDFLEKAHPVGIDMGLTRIQQVRSKLGLEFKCPVITVAGTNGKGSTCAFLESILAEAGYKVACHTSPHFLDFTERARIGRINVSEEKLLQHFQAVETARSSCDPMVSLTYFEFTTLAILHLFAHENLDVVILEVGLGGRLDAVNIIDADCAIITSIDLDHTQLLGNTRELIGREKAGIMRSGKIAICADPVPPQTIIDYAQSLGVDLWLHGRDFNISGDQQQWGWSGRAKRIHGLAYPALRGANQLLNAAAVLAALTALREVLPVGVQAIRNGFAMVDLPGRFQVLPGQPTIVMDVAHNPHASSVLAQSVEKMGYFPYTHAIFGVMSDKDIAGVIRPMLEVVDYWHCVNLPTPRAAKAEEIADVLIHLGVKNTKDSGVIIQQNPESAYQKTLEEVGQNDRIVVFGSFYTVSAVMNYRKLQKN
jgi:dihydrofolate synthase / folylpolyglutamate synthase